MTFKLRNVALPASLLLALACANNEQGPQLGVTRDQLLDPQSCQGCHPVHYRQWAGSMHAYASTDPVFLALNKQGQEETSGELGTFCVNCHAPMAVREGLTTDGLNLHELPKSMQGVTCYFCHNVESVEGNHNNPLRLANNTTMLGGITDPESNPAHSSEYSEIFASGSPADGQLCGPCHDIQTPSPPASVSVHLEQTFAEWKDSIFGEVTCSGCHIPTEIGPVAVDGPKDRVLHGHQFAGVDVALTPFPAAEDVEDAAQVAAEQRLLVQELLDQTLGVDICVQRTSATNAVIEVTLDNVGAGHHFPSGATLDRRVWVEVKAYTEGETEPYYQSGIVGPDQGVAELDDPDIWELHDRGFDRNEKPAHLFWQVARVERRSIPGAVTNDPNTPEFYRTHAIRRFPKTGSEPAELLQVPDKVTVLVRMRPVGFDVLSELVESGRLEQSVMDQVPTFDLVSNRHLSEHPTLSSLATLTFEWSDAVRQNSQFRTWRETARPFPKECVGLARRP